MELLIKKNKDISLSTIVFSTVLTVFIFVIMVINFNSNLSLLQIITFALNGIVILVTFVRGLLKYRFSLDLVHSIFCLLFFWIAPILQLTTGFNAWGIKITDSGVVKTNICILIWLLLYNLGSLFAGNKDWKIRSYDYSAIRSGSIGLLIIIYCFVTVIILVLKKFDIERSLFVSSDTQALALLIDHSLTAFMLFSTIISIKWLKSEGYSRLITFLFIFCLLLTCFPTSLSRYAAGSIYMCVVVCLSQWIRKKYRLILTIILGIVFLFPIMGLYRYASITEVPLSTIFETLTSIDGYFNTGNYDAYQMLMLTLDFVEEFGVTYGRQLVGALLFFIPRQIWSTKPVGSGSYMSSIMGLDFDNISCPLVAESYINFGVIGVCIFAILIGYCLRKIDNTYWHNNREEFSYINLIYFYMLPYLLFLCRGDMMSTWAYLFANIFVSYVLFKILELFREGNNK